MKNRKSIKFNGGLIYMLDALSTYYAQNNYADIICDRA